MFEYTTKDGLLTVKEALNGFYLYHNPSGECRGLGDGVDMFYGIKVGSRSFYAALQGDIESAKSDYLEAYFGREI